jgi:hypothetical protein
MLSTRTELGSKAKKVWSGLGTGADRVELLELVRRNASERVELNGDGKRVGGTTMCYLQEQIKRREKYYVCTTMYVLVIRLISSTLHAALITFCHDNQCNADGRRFI